MGWNRDRSLQRISEDLERLDADGGVEVEKLKKEMDLQNLTDKKCREIYGAHVYATVSNFPEHASAAPTQENDYKKFIRSVHSYQSVVVHIVEQLFDAAFVHFQGPKLHAVVYRPIDDSKKIADKALLLQLALHDFAKNVFNDASEFKGDFKLASGGDIGNAIGTRNGQVSDRELLFIGDPANKAAHVVGGGGARIRPGLQAALSQDLKDLCIISTDGTFYTVTTTPAKLAELLEARGIKWNRDDLKKRVQEKESSVALKDITYSDANEKINPDALSIRDNKRLTAASVFADLSGFTKYVAGKIDDVGKKAALRVFHAIRRESSVISKNDYDGVRIQYQGDRIQVIFHVPKGEEAKIALEALKAAAAMHSAIEDTLRAQLPEITNIHYAIGIDMGPTLVTKLGSHGQRDRICLGTAVENAQRLEDKVAQSKETAISKKVRDLLPDYAQKSFTEKGSDYVASGLTLDKLEKAQKATQTNGTVNVAKTSAGTAVSSTVSGTPVQPSKSWGS